MSPVPVSLVSASESDSSDFNSFRCFSPASVTFVPERSSLRRLFTRTRRDRPSSVTAELARLSSLRFSKSASESRLASLNPGPTNWMDSSFPRLFSDRRLESLNVTFGDGERATTSCGESGRVPSFPRARFSRWSCPFAASAASTDSLIGVSPYPPRSSNCRFLRPRSSFSPSLVSLVANVNRSIRRFSNAATSFMRSSV